MSNRSIRPHFSDTNVWTWQAHRPHRGRALATGGEAFEYVFPAIRGIQAEHEFYVTMCPLRLIPKILLYDEDELVPEMRAQRTLNRRSHPRPHQLHHGEPLRLRLQRVDCLGRRQDPLRAIGDEATHSDRIGLLAISMDTQFVINDGQHRRAAITGALKKDPTLADESIALVLFYDEGLKRSQQMFADLNRHAIKTSPSLGVLYDHRDETRG